MNAALFAAKRFLKVSCAVAGTKSGSTHTIEPGTQKPNSFGGNFSVVEVYAGAASILGAGFPTGFVPGGVYRNLFPHWGQVTSKVPMFRETRRVALHLGQKAATLESPGVPEEVLWEVDFVVFPEGLFFLFPFCLFSEMILQTPRRIRTTAMRVANDMGRLLSIMCTFLQKICPNKQAKKLRKNGGKLSKTT